MSSESSTIMSEENGLELNETELTLGLPGVTRGKKRGLPSLYDMKVLRTSEDFGDDHSDTECSDVTKPSPKKKQVIGWPPVNLFRKNVVKSKFKFVKVAVDGAPYLRKVDLESYASYQQLLRALEHISSCFTIENVRKEKKLMDLGEYVTTYEDKDGDWMLVGDVPWKMFVDTCKRIRLMRSSEASNGIVTNSNCSFSSC
uniref:Auxin-responsive protein n=1 Tax=Tanacetum cinerariifolium TaxID=118510 RepID=A0A699I8R1_TANCI|nr:auxin-responsive protein IAA1-like [Tanacetum cinerariifolium]